MQHIARLLDIPGQSGPPSPAYVGTGVYSPRTTGRGCRDNRPLFHTGRVPGFAAPRRDSLPGVVHRSDPERKRRDQESPNRPPSGRKDGHVNGAIKREAPSRDPSGSRAKSREGSPRMPRPRSEEIPLELIKKAPNSILDMSPKVTIVPPARIEPEVTVTNEQPVLNVISTIASEETSFIAQENTSTPKRKGTVETV